MLKHIFLLLILPACLAAADEEFFLGDHFGGNRSTPVHTIPPYYVDIEGKGVPVKPNDQPALPFSTRPTCGRCHDYETIHNGWHFNAPDKNVPPGRPGEPWLYVDQASGTQIPVSSRPWPGTYRPEQVGLTPWKFVLKFGRQMPGGGLGEKNLITPPDLKARWNLSGNYEVNCLSCHNLDPAHDQTLAGDLIRGEAFMWIPAATSNMAQVTGDTRRLPNTFDIYMGVDLDHPELTPPVTKYDPSYFKPDGKIFFDLSRRPPADRCYFCHSTFRPDEQAPPHWQQDSDVHLAAGLRCTDCHRNGVDHMITRGYEGEAADMGKPAAVSSLTCRGCHLPEPGATEPKNGRLGAPRPAHKGLPPIHLHNISCTACHAGAWPQAAPATVQTAMAHGLGVHGILRTPASLPHIQAPVFIREGTGPIQPRKVVWPAFWARLTGDQVAPFDPELVTKLAGQIFALARTDATGWRRLTNEQIAQILEILAQAPAGEVTTGSPVYIAGGKLYQRDAKGSIVAADHPAARFYSWAIGHDVRPAAQSLGASGCADCHATDSPMVFGAALVDTPVAGEPVRIPMYTLMGQSGSYMRNFATSFMFRTMLKVVGFAACGLVILVLLAGAVRAIPRLNPWK